MSKHKTKLFLFFFLVFWNGLILAQIKVEGRVKSIHESPIYLSVYWKNTHQLIPVSKKGKFSFRLAAFEECLVAVYQEKTYPKTISINTYAASKRAIRLNVNLEKANPSNNAEFSTAPSQRILTNNTKDQRKEFDLDDLEDKLSFGQLMTKLNKDLNKFYTQGVLPSERINYDSKLGENELGKSEHRLGVEIYHLLKKKKELDNEIKSIQTKELLKHSNTALSDCQLDLRWLKKEANLTRIVSELSIKRLDREKLRFRRRQSAGKSSSNRAIRLAQKNMEYNRRRYEIAGLNMRNKQIDCWETKLQSDLDLQLSKGTTADNPNFGIQQLDISDIRYTRLIENARQLYEHHNQLANELKGRDRIVQLAHVQKYISDQEQLRFYQTENAVQRWQLKNRKQGKFEESIEKAIQTRERQRDVAYQAEMAYLEHMWHLRDRVGMYDEADDLYKQQTSLLGISNFRTPRTDSAEKDLKNFEKALDKILVLENSKDERGAVKKLQFKEAYYEIVVNEKGEKSYFKNQKPITKLTYAFETKRKFGEILKNIRYEKKSKASLFDFFRKKID